MLFGNKKKFAVEIELSGEPINNFLYGKFCYWINNIQVGDYEFDTLLNDVLLDLTAVKSYCGKRVGNELCHLSTDKLYELIEQSIYGEDFFERDNTIYTEILRDSLKYKITLPLDVMTDWQGFLIECHKNEIIVFKQVNDISVRSLLLPAGLFCKIIGEAEIFLGTILLGFPH